MHRNTPIMRELQFEKYQPVNVTILGTPEILTSGSVLDRQGSRISMILVRSVRPGTLLKVEWDNYMLLGEVIDSGAGDSSRVQIRVEHAILDTRELELAANECQ